MPFHIGQMIVHALEPGHWLRDIVRKERVAGVVTDVAADGSASVTLFPPNLPPVHVEGVPAPAEPEPAAAADPPAAPDQNAAAPAA